MASLVVGPAATGIRGPIVSGLWYDNAVVEPATRANAKAIPAGFLIFVPFVPARTFVAKAIGMYVTTAAASTTARLAIFTDATGKPGSLLVETATLDTSTTGVKSATIAQSLTAGRLYWLGAQVSGAGVQAQGPAPTGACTIGLVAASDTNTIKRAYVAQAYGAFPSTAPAVTRDTQDTAVSVMLQAT